jgi:hypothetical protein
METAASFEARFAPWSHPANESLLATLADMPTPSGSTPRQIDAGLVPVYCS